MSYAAGIDTALAAAQMGVGIYGNQKNKKYNKRVRALEDRSRNRNFAYGQKQITEAQSDINRDAHTAKQDAASNAEERGIFNSSIRTAKLNNLEEERARRYNRLQERKDLQAYNFADESQGIKIRRAQEKFNQQMAMIQAGIQGGASGVGSYMGA